MPRIRTIKPEFFRSRKLSECSVRTRLTFIGLWTACDDEGRYQYEPELLEADLWPYERDTDVAAVVDELAKRGFVCFYEVAGKRYLHVVNWHEHQKINRPTPSKLPECSRNSHGGFPEDSGPRARAREVEVEVEVEREKEQGSKTIVEQARPIDDITAVFVAWQEATRKHRARLDPKRRRRIREALKHYPLADVLDAVQGWQHSPHHIGQNPSGAVYNDLDLLLRDAEHLEKFRDLWRDGPPVALGKATQQAKTTYDQLQQWAGGESGEQAGMDPDRHEGDQRRLAGSAD